MQHPSDANPADNRRPGALTIAACVGAVGGFGVLLLFLFFIFAFPDAQGGIGLVFAPFFSAAVGILLAASTWGIVTAKRGNYAALALALPALCVLVLLLSWFISEIQQI